MEIGNENIIAEEKSVDENYFWEVVERVQWSSDHNYGRIKQELLSLIPQSHRKALLKLVESINERLYGLIMMSDEELWEDLGLSDDGLGDLSAHIIGLGKTVYDECMKDLNHLSKYVDSAEENFLYSFHALEDAE